MKFIYATTNDAKFKIAESVLLNTGVQVIQSGIDIPEIQSTSVEEIASYSCKWAREQLQCSVAVTDVGFYIHALGGFPGPFVKYVNGWLSSEDIIRLLADKQDRTVEIRECLAFYRMDAEPMIFQSVLRGEIVYEAASHERSVMDRIVIPEGSMRTLAELKEEELISFWSKHSAFHLLKERLSQL